MISRLHIIQEKAHDFSDECDHLLSEVDRVRSHIKDACFEKELHDVENKVIGLCFKVMNRSLLNTAPPFGDHLKARGIKLGNLSKLEITIYMIEDEAVEMDVFQEQDGAKFWMLEDDLFKIVPSFIKN